jgi:purine-nucleoside phosphorylase
MRNTPRATGNHAKMNKSASDYEREIDEAVLFVKSRSQRPWRTLLVLGSGLGALADQVVDPVHIPYADVPHFAQSTVPGHSGRFVIGDLFGTPVAVMQGRVHFYEGHRMWQVALPVRVAKRMGAQTMIVTNAAGGVNRSFSVADLMLITDHINFLGMAGVNPLIGPNLDAFGPRFPEMTTAYDAALQTLARNVAAQRAVPLQEGVYFGLAGPGFESPAEIRFLRAIGADAVGMSTVNEVLVARHCGIRVLGFSGITNVARLSADEGEPPTHEEVMTSSVVIGPKLQSVLTGVLEALR